MSDNEQPLTDSEWLIKLSGGLNSNSARTLGIQVDEVDQEAQTVTAHCVVNEDFINPNGTIQGGFLTAILDEVTAIASYVMTDGVYGLASLEIKTTYIRAARPGTLRVVGKVLKIGQKVGFVEGFIYDEQDTLLTKMSSTAIPFKIPEM
jgi:uncharacterized protein (TIGR00369 family)